MNTRGSASVFVVPVIVLLLVGTIFAFFFMTVTVPEGHQGVETSWGATTGNTLSPGLHIVMPWEGAYDYNVRQSLYVMSAMSGEGDKGSSDDSIAVRSADRVKVDVDAAVTWQADPSEVVTSYNEVGTENVQEGYVRSASRSAIRQAGSEYNWDELYKGSARAEFAAEATRLMQADLADKGVIVHDVQIRNVRVPDRIDSAIEAKEAAAEQIEQKRNEVEVARQEAERKRVEAAGIADSQEIIDESLTDEYLTWYWVDNLDEHDSVYYVPVGENGQPVLTKDVEQRPGE